MICLSVTVSVALTELPFIPAPVDRPKSSLRRHHSVGDGIGWMMECREIWFSFFSRRLRLRAVEHSLFCPTISKAQNLAYTSEGENSAQELVIALSERGITSRLVPRELWRKYGRMMTRELFGGGWFHGENGLRGELLRDPSHSLLLSLSLKAVKPVIQWI